MSEAILEGDVEETGVEGSDAKVPEVALFVCGSEPRRVFDLRGECEVSPAIVEITCARVWVGGEMGNGTSGRISEYSRRSVEPFAEMVVVFEWTGLEGTGIGTAVGAGEGVTVGVDSGIGELTGVR